MKFYITYNILCTTFILYTGYVTTSDFRAIESHLEVSFFIYNHSKQEYGNINLNVINSNIAIYLYPQAISTFNNYVNHIHFFQSPNIQFDRATFDNLINLESLQLYDCVLRDPPSLRGSRAKLKTLKLRGVGKYYIIILL